MPRENQSVYMCDFETTVFKGQTYTEVWVAACVELNTEDVKIFHSIDDQFEFFCGLQKTKIIGYYHNLKFDGSFWIYFLVNKLGYTQAGHYDEKGEFITEWVPDKEMQKRSFKYIISEMGQWYSITIRTEKTVIELRDSLKLLPFSVEKIGKSFGTKHKKLNMEYEGYRYAGCEITDEEKRYIANDVLVVKEALEIMFAEGHNRLTIGSCCLNEYKKTQGKAYKNLFPDLTVLTIDQNVYGYADADSYIRKSYRGGWCYLVKGKENIPRHGGTTADVNSLYPSMMSGESGNRYPIGEPTFWHGNYIPEEAKGIDRFYFVRIRTRFRIRDGMLPFIQIKGNLLYRGTECLTTSDIVNPKTGKHSRYYRDMNGNVCDTFVTLTLTMMDYELFLKHYEPIDCTILDGCWFHSSLGLFDEYMEKYRKQKIESKGAKRELAKLFLNNLYGKMASNTNSSFKVAYTRDDGSLGYYVVEQNNKTAGYIPVGTAITSYARCFTITAAQANYYGPDQPGFIYADTDSIHCDLPPEAIKGITVHPRNFCCWKLESCWDYGLFVRQKTYLEHVTAEDLEPIEKPYYNVRCAGMPDRCKNLFLRSVESPITNPTETERKEYTEAELKFLKDKREISDFKLGLIVPGKLVAKNIRGGVLLCDTTYEMR